MMARKIGYGVICSDDDTAFKMFRGHEAILCDVNQHFCVFGNKDEAEKTAERLTKCFDKKFSACEVFDY